MKIHFIYPNVDVFRYPGVHHGLAFISSVLKMHGHNVSLHYVMKRPSTDEIIDGVKRVQPDLIGFSSTTNQIRFVELWSKWIKEEFDIPTICGGVHATLMPEEVISFDGIDMVCIGEGEYPMLDLANGCEPAEIKNLWIKGSNEIAKNELRPLIDPLDDLPFPDYNLFDCERILKERGALALLASRGCPFNCSYCCNHALKKALNGAGRYFRLRSVDNVLQQIEVLKSKYGDRIRRLNFADDTFSLSKKWALEFCEKYRAKFDMEFECDVRVETVDEELLRDLKSANCAQIDVGVESGNEWIRKEVLKRGMSNEQIIKVFDMAHSFGIKTQAFNMIGLPYETPEMIEETISLNKRLRPDYLSVSFFYPYPQTELWRICKKEGFLTDKYSTDHVRESIVALPTVSPKELNKLYTKLYTYGIERQIESFHPLLRLPLRIVSLILAKLLGKRWIHMVMKLQLSYSRFPTLLMKG